MSVQTISIGQVSFLAEMLEKDAWVRDHFDLDPDKVWDAMWQEDKATFSDKQRKFVYHCLYTEKHKELHEVLTVIGLQPTKLP